MLSVLAITLAGYGVAALLGMIGRRALALVYGLSAIAAGVTAFVAVRFLLAGATPETAVLPIGLPWMGTHLRIDALSGFFLLVLGVAGALVSIFALECAR